MGEGPCQDMGVGTLIVLNEQIKCFQCSYRLPTDYPCTVIAMGLVYGGDWGKVKNIVEFCHYTAAFPCVLSIA